MWHDRTGFYYDIFTEHPGIVPNVLNHKTVAGFWPLLAEAASARQAGRLAEQLLNPETFHTPHPVPTLSRDDPNYDPHGAYWLGGVWAPTNYMVVRGLQNYGADALARQIAVDHLSMMAATFANESYASLWEAYSPEYARPATAKEDGRLVRPRFVGWTGLGPIAMLIEQVLGLSFNLPERTVRWDICTPGRHGIENLRMGPLTFRATCSGWAPDNSPTILKIETSEKIELTTSLMYEQEQTVTLEAGRHEMRR